MWERDYRKVEIRFPLTAEFLRKRTTRLPPLLLTLGRTFRSSAERDDE